MIKLVLSKKYLVTETFYFIMLCIFEYLKYCLYKSIKIIL